MRQLSNSQIANIAKLQKLADAGSIETVCIKNITTKKYNGKVYDIQVSNTNTYSLNGIFSSNSVGGSLVCYLLGITSLDPLKWGLSFDRFLSTSRGGYMLNIKAE